MPLIVSSLRQRPWGIVDVVLSRPEFGQAAAVRVGVKGVMHLCNLPSEIACRSLFSGEVAPLSRGGVSFDAVRLQRSCCFVRALVPVLQLDQPRRFECVPLS